MAYNPPVNVVSVVKRLLAFSLLFSLLLAACSQGSGTPEIVPSLVPLATVTAQMAETAGATESDTIPAGTVTADAATAESVSADASTETPTEPPPSNTLSVSDQELRDDGRLIIERVEASQPGWIVIYGDEDGDPGDIMAFAEVARGVTGDLVVEVDPLRATPHLYAILHSDEGEAGVFEFPGPDSPVQVDDEAVAAEFMVEIIVRLPSLVVADQLLTEEETIVIDSVVIGQNGWIALHMDEDGQPGQMLSYLPLLTGETKGLTLSLNWRVATPYLHAVLYLDAGKAGVFEDLEIDAPLLIDDQPVANRFQVTLPPDIFVLDQPVVDGEIVVERVISYGPGWIVVYHDDEGSLGNIIGWADLEDGINQDIRFPVVESAVTPLLHAMIHQDLEAVGEFGFPRTDPPVMFRDRVPNPVTFRTDSGNYLVARDQSLSVGNTITVPLVVVDEDAFVVIRIAEDGQPGEISSLTWVPAGVNRDVIVELGEDLATGDLYAELYLDAASDQEFDFPDGLDIPMQRNRAIIQALFALLPSDEG